MGSADALFRLSLDHDEALESDEEKIVCAIEEQQLDNLPLRGKDLTKATKWDTSLPLAFIYTLHDGQIM